jgi:hypothetical protein
MATTEEPPPSILSSLTYLIPGYTPVQETLRMETFDHIEEPRRPTPLTSRRHSQVSPLQAYQIEEYRPPPVPKPPKPEGYIHPGFICMWLIWVIGLGVWLACVIRYRYNLFPTNSVLNPIRNPGSFSIFLYFLVLSSFISLVIIPWVFALKRPRVLAVSLAVFVTYVIMAVLALTHITINDPYACQHMSSKFPISVTMQAGKTGNANVYINQQLSWHMKHEKVNRLYHTWISAEYLVWDRFLKKYIEQDIIWPNETAVNDIYTSLIPAAGADGNVTGTCKGVPCLEGKIWTHPNLKFEWVYTNPVTGEKRTTTLASNEGQWYYGMKNRALVTLHSDGTEVFRAQSTTTVCTAGDGQLETSLVPVGLMFIAENKYMGIK